MYDVTTVRIICAIRVLVCVCLVGVGSWFLPGVQLRPCGYTVLSLLIQYASRA